MEVLVKAVPRKNKATGQKELYWRTRLPNGDIREKKGGSQMEAVQWAARLAALTVNPTEPSTVTIGGLGKLYLDAQWARVERKQLTVKYFEEMRKVILGFTAFVDCTTPAMKLIRKQVSDYLDGVADAISINTSHVHHKHIKRLVSWAESELEFPRDWLTLPKRLRRTEAVKRPMYTPAEINALLGAATAQERLILEIFLETAGRKEEVFGLEWSDVDLTRGGIKLRTRKGLGGVKERIIAIPEDLTAKLRERRKANMGSVYVFTNPQTGTRWFGGRKWLELIEKRAKVTPMPGRGFHGLRRTAAVMDRATAQKRLGHERATTTDLYLEHLGETQNMPSVLGLIQQKVTAPGVLPESRPVSRSVSDGD